IGATWGGPGGLRWFLVNGRGRAGVLLVLYRGDPGVEVDHQANVGSAAVVFSVYCAMGYLLIQFFA
ncbi:hypothetical protein CWC07_19055, partial [Pseudoalteromonas ruthenica]